MVIRPHNDEVQFAV